MSEYIPKYPSTEGDDSNKTSSELLAETLKPIYVPQDLMLAWESHLASYSRDTHLLLDQVKDSELTLNAQYQALLTRVQKYEQMLQDITMDSNEFTMDSDVENFTGWNILAQASYWDYLLRKEITKLRDQIKSAEYKGGLVTEVTDAVLEGLVADNNYISNVIAALSNTPLIQELDAALTSTVTSLSDLQTEYVSLAQKQAADAEALANQQVLTAEQLAASMNSLIAEQLDRIADEAATRTRVLQELDDKTDAIAQEASNLSIQLSQEAVDRSAEITERLGVVTGEITQNIGAITDRINTEVATRNQMIADQAQAILYESEARAADISTQAAALAAETQARADALKAEAQARTEALNAEALARANAIDDEAQARAAAISAEAQERVDAINKEVTDRTAVLLAETNARKAAIEAERDARIQELNDKVAALTADYAARISQLNTDLSATIQTLSDGVTVSVSKLESADASIITSLDAYKVSNNLAVAAVVDSVNTVTNAHSATVQRVDGLTASFNGLDAELAQTQADIVTTKNLITSGDHALAEQISTLSASLDSSKASLQSGIDSVNTAVTGLDTATATKFADVNAKIQATDTKAGNAVTAAANAQTTANSAVTTNTAQAAEISNLKSRMTTTEGNVAKKADTTALNALTTQVENLGTDMSVQAGAITSLKAELDTVDSKTDSAIASAAAAQNTANSAVSTNAAQATEIVDLKARVATTEANISKKADASALTTLETKVNSNDSALSQRLDSLSAAITDLGEGAETMVDVYAFNALKAEVTNTQGVVSGHTSDISTLQNKLNVVEETVGGNSAAITANSGAINETSSKVTSLEGTVASQGSSITSLQSGLATTNTNVTAAQNAANAANTLAGSKGKVLVQTTAPAAADRLAQNLWIDITNGANTPKRWNGSAWVAVTDKVATDAASAAANALSVANTKADASAFNALDTKVTTIEGTVTSHGSSITKLTNDLAATNSLVATKANTTALNSLDTKVTEVEGKVTTNTSSITSLTGRVSTVESNVAKKADASVLNNYYTKTQSDASATTIAAGEVNKFNASLVIGGVNQLLNSEGARTSAAATNREYLLYESSAHLKQFYDDNLGKDITVSFEIMVPVAGAVQVYSSNGSAHTYSVPTPSIEANTWTKVVVTLKPQKHPSTPNQAVSTLEFYGTYGTGRIPTVRKVQLEAGNKATAWSPSPRDTKAALDANSTAINNTNTEVTRINGVVVAQGSSITKLQSDLATVDAATKTAINSAATAQQTANTGVTKADAAASATSTLKAAYEAKVAKIDATIAANATKAASDLTSAQTTLANADTALGTRIDNLTTTVTNNNTAVKGQIKEVSDSVTSLTGSTNTKFESLESSISTVGLNAQGAQDSADEAMAAAVAAQGTANTAVTNSAKAQSTADSAVTANTATASRVSTLESEMDAVESGLATKASANALQSTNTEVSRVNGVVTSQGTSITNLTNNLNTTTTNANKALSAVEVKDTRSTNELPQWYWTNHPKRIVNEFKTASVIGVTGLGLYVNLETRVYYNDSSGGPILQTAIGVANPLLQMVRRSSGSGSNVVWSAWEQPLKTIQDTIDTKASTSALNSLDSKVTSIDGRVTANATSISTLQAGLTETNDLLGTVKTATAKAQDTANSAVTANNAVANRVADLEAGLDTVEADLATKATTTALGALDTKVTNIDGKVTSQGSSITKLQSDLAVTNSNVNKKADAAALSALDTKVTAQGNDLATNANQITQLSADINNVNLRGQDLVSNGLGQLGSNKYWSSTTFTAQDKPAGAGSFLSALKVTQITGDELIAVDPSRAYKLSYYLRQTVQGAVAYAYGMFIPYDVDKKPILPEYYMAQANTLTTLALPLKKGDTTITLTDASKWNNNAGVNSHLRTVILWNYVDGTGYKWSANTYSRNSYINVYDDKAINSNVITLRSPWNGAEAPAGTEISNGSSGGTYMYIGAVGQTIPQTWTLFSGTVEGAHPSGMPMSASNKFPMMTAYVRIGFLVNRTLAGGVDEISRMAFGGVSLRDWSVASDASLAKTSALNTTNVEVSRINGVVVTQGSSISKLQSDLSTTDAKAGTALNNAATAQTTANTGVTKAEAAASSVNTLKSQYESKVALLDSADAANATAITKTNTDLSNAQTTLSNADKALGSRIDSLTTTVTNNNTTVTGSIQDVADSVTTLEGNTNTRFTNLQSSLNNLSTTVGTKADASALSTLTTRVANVEGVNTTQATSINTLNSNITKLDELTRVMNSGKLVYTDPTFKVGVNGVLVYNNTNNGNVTITRQARSTDNPTTSTHELLVKTVGAASPVWGGIFQFIQARANAVFLVKYIAKLPTGYSLLTASNALGNGATDKLYGQTTGTGKFETLYRIIRCGPDGSFSNGGHLYVNGSPSPTAESPLQWVLASIELYDCTDFQDAPTTVLNSIADAKNTANTAVSQGQANASAINSLTTTVNTNNAAVNGRIDTVANSVTTLEGNTNSQINRLDSALTAVDAKAATGIANTATAQNTADTAVSKANANASDITVLGSRLEVAETGLVTKASADALNSLTTRVTDVEGVNTSQGTAITNLQNTINHSTTGLATKASTSALTAVDNKVTAANGRIDTTNSALTALTGRVDTVEGTVATKADAAALTSLTTRVTNAEGINTSQGNAITSLENTINHATTGLASKASSAALTVVDNKVTAANGRIDTTNSNLTTLTGRVGTVEGAVSTKADATALTNLTTRVTNAEGVNTSQGTAITTLQNTVNHATTGLATKASTSALTATNSEVSRVDGVVTGHTNQLTQLTSDITAINGTLATKANASALNDYYTKTQADAKATTIAAGEVSKYAASLVIGGTNLATKNSSDANHNTLVMGTSGYYREFHTGVVLEVGKAYTFSIVVEKLPGYENVAINIHLGTANTDAGGYAYDLPNARQNNVTSGERVVITFTPTAAQITPTGLAERRHLMFRIRNENIRADVTFRQVQVEEGTVPTAWSPSYLNVESALDANATAINNTNAEVSRVDGRVTTEANRITTLSGRVDTVEGQVSTKAEADALTALTTRVTNAEGVNTSQGSDITTLQNTVNHSTTGLATKASSSALTAVDNKVTAADGRIDVTNSNVAALTGRVSTVEGNLTTKADVSAVNALTTRVGNVEGGLATQATNTTNLTASLAATDKVAKDALPQISSLSNYKVFRNVLNYYYPTASSALALVIQTPITFTTKMFKVTVTGYNYSTNRSNINLEVSGYAYSGTSILEHGAINHGTFPLSVKLGIRDSKLVIILLRTTQNWAYTQFNIDAEIGYTLAPDTWKNDWSVTPMAEADFATNGITAIITPSTKDMPTEVTANANAITTTNTEVSRINGVVTGHTTQLTNLTASIAGKADTSALNALTARVEAEEGKSTSQATSITNLSSSVTDALKAVTIADTRSTNEPPSWYLTNYPRRVVNEFKAQTAIGVSGLFGGTYCNLETKVYYTDLSGGDLIQTATSSTDPSLYVQRRSSGTSAWTAWVQPIKGLRDDIGTKASATALNTLDTKVTTIDGKVTTQASQITTLTSDNTANKNALQVQATVIDGVKANYMVKMETNGVIGGFGLMQSTGVLGQVQTSFGVNANAFFIGAPSGGKKPFVVTTAGQQIDGITYPAGTYIDVALIANATIGNAKIADLAVTNAKIANATIESAKIKSIKADKIEIGNPLVGPITPSMVTGTSLTNAANLFNSSPAANASFATYGTGTQSATSGAETNYIQVDVGATVSMPEVRFFFRGSAGRKTYIKLKASVDGVNWDYIMGSATTWETIDDVPPSPGSDYSTVINQAAFSWYGVKPYRYLRLYGNGSSASTTNELVAIIGNASGNITKIGSEGILTNSITADRLDVKDLSAISANLGTIQVGSANIANGAITTAKIGDLQVDTLKIKGNAVTVPQTYVDANATTFSITSLNTWYTISTFRVTEFSGNGDALVFFKPVPRTSGGTAQIGLSFGDNFTDRTCEYGLFVDETLVRIIHRIRATRGNGDPRELPEYDLPVAVDMLRVNTANTYCDISIRVRQLNSYNGYYPAQFKRTGQIEYVALVVKR